MDMPGVMGSASWSSIENRERFPNKEWHKIMTWTRRADNKKWVMYFTAMMARDFAIAEKENQELVKLGITLWEKDFSFARQAAEIYSRLARGKITKGEVILLMRWKERLGLDEPVIDYMYKSNLNERMTYDIREITQGLATGWKGGRPQIKEEDLISPGDRRSMGSDFPFGEWVAVYSWALDQPTVGGVRGTVLGFLGKYAKSLPELVGKEPQLFNYAKSKIFSSTFVKTKQVNEFRRRFKKDDIWSSKVLLLDNLRKKHNCSHDFLQFLSTKWEGSDDVKINLQLEKEEFEKHKAGKAQPFHSLDPAMMVEWIGENDDTGLFRCLEHTIQLARYHDRIDKRVWSDKAKLCSTMSSAVMRVVSRCLKSEESESVCPKKVVRGQD